MKQIFRAILFIGYVSAVLAANTQAWAAPTEIAEFPFNRAVAVQHARATIEDFGMLTMKEQPFTLYDYSKPFVAGVLGKDCENKEMKIVMVAFPEKKGNGWAYSQLERNKDGLIHRMLSVGFSAETLEELMNRARSGSALCD